MKSSDIRQAFIDYFSRQGHEVVPSSSLIPFNDATLLFTNAGMVQFKDTFLGLEPRTYTRAVSAQRCVRAGGKHNDLENVGYTARHHTFFEMLGNFSFGDYFKAPAIKMAWAFLTDVLKLPAERLWVTVYEDDDEAAAIWLNEVGVSPLRFSRCGEKDNFWSMGDTGPCGPCTEIFYDHGAEIPGGPPGTPEADGDRYIEIWNLVFMQFNRDKSGQLHPLPKPSVDTGMGLERITAVVQGVHNNYHIDSFQHIIRAIHAKAPACDKEHPSFKVIADHIRACSFLLADGVVPSNEGRGYVLRRIIRRAVRHGHKLGLPSPFFYQLVQPLIDVMGEAYPSLVEQQTLIEQALLQEETQFVRTLEHGLKLLQDYLQTLQGKLISGEMAFKLYDTYGFPLDLTADIAREQGLEVDMDAFNRCMQQQREQSQQASQFEVDYSRLEEVNECSAFQGYEKDSLSSEVLVLLKDGKRVDALKEGEKGIVVLADTPFYAESGGQVGDRGQLRASHGAFVVNHTKRVGQAIFHEGTVTEGYLSLHDAAHAEIDQARRAAIRLNHTATHLLHAALKTILGSHVQQKGSLVDAERARFDFSHKEGLSKDQWQQVEALVNQQIRLNHLVETNVMAIDAAKQSGAVALFGEKYADEVRVLSIGAFSKELCGGTHARRTGDIGLFKIVSEYGVASGVRRIEMVTGAYALEWVDQQLDALNDAAARLKSTGLQLPEKIAQLLAELKQQEKEQTALKAKLASQSGQSLKQEAQQIGNVTLLVKELVGSDGQALRVMLDQLRSSMESAVIVLYTKQDNKLQVVAGVSKSLLGQVPSAGEFVKLLCGKGGGREDMAQGGGMVPDDFAARLAKVPELLLGST